MFGESFTRATQLATRLVRELDPLDRVTVLACDAECRALPGGCCTPSAEVAADTERFLSGIAPEGASDPTAAVKSAVAAAGSADARSLRVIYIGDGSPTVGPIRPAYVARAVEDALPPGRGTLTAVAIGADSDLDTLAALARGGGGVVLPFVPGQTTAEAAFAVLGTSYGNALRDVAVELPEGLVETAPQRLDTIPAGSESLVVARMTRARAQGHGHAARQARQGNLRAALHGLDRRHANRRATPSCRGCTRRRASPISSAKRAPRPSRTRSSSARRSTSRAATPRCWCWRARRCSARSASTTRAARRSGPAKSRPRSQRPRAKTRVEKDKALRTKWDLSDSRAAMP